MLRRWIESRAEPEPLRPLGAEARARAVGLLVEAGELTRAAAAWRALAADGPEAAALLDALLAAALRAEARDVLEALEPELREERTARSSLALHRLLIDRGEWARAEAVEREFLARHPRHPARYALVLARARRESRSGSPEAGLRLAREAARLRPDRAAGFVEQAIALRALERTSAARRAVRAALRVEPDDALALRLAEELDPADLREPEHRISIELRRP
jgi:tetratricopeptide (TPR) repeat protein